MKKVSSWVLCGDWAGISNKRNPTLSRALRAFFEFCLGSPSCKKSLPLVFSPFSNITWNWTLAKLANTFPVNFSSYIAYRFAYCLSSYIAYKPYSNKETYLPPICAFIPVTCYSKTFVGFPPARPPAAHALLVGFILWVNPAPSK